MKYLVSFLLSFITIVSVHAAESELLKSEILDPIFEAKITVDEYVPIDKAVLFDASDSQLLEEEEFGPASFRWDFHNGGREEIGREQIYSFDSIGKKRITLTVRQGGQETTTEREIFPYQKKALLITDQDQKSFQELQLQAAENGTWLKISSVTTEEAKFLTEEKLSQEMGESAEFLKESNLLIFYTESVDSLAVFTRYLQTLPEEEKIQLGEKTFVNISNGNLGILKNIIDRSRKSLKVESVLLTRPEALNPIFEQEEILAITDTLNSRAIEYVVIDERVGKSGIFFLSSLVSFFISSGIPSNTVYLLLAFPFIAFFVTFSRQFIGFSTYGMYLPIMLSLSFFILGVNFAFAVITIVGVLGFLIRQLFQKVEMLYIPKVALTLSAIALSFFLVIWFAIRIDASITLSLALFPMLVISTISERFIVSQSQEGLIGAVLAMIETILVSFLAYLLTSWSYLHDLILSVPEIMILPFIGIIILGRFTGLRITEYFKFRSLLNEGVEE